MNPNFRRIRKTIPVAFCLVIVLLWLISRSQARVFLVSVFGGHALAAASGDGGIGIFGGKVDFDGVVTTSGDLRSFAVLGVAPADLHALIEELLDHASSKASRAGIRAAIGPNATNPLPALGGFVLVTLPYWLLLLIAAPGIVLPVRRWLIRQRRKRKGLCQTCGYDLRMSPGRCPECGAEDALIKA